MLCKLQYGISFVSNNRSRCRYSSTLIKRYAHIYTYVATSREKDFSIALKECLDDLSSNFSVNPTIAFMFSSHKTIQESQYRRLYKSNKWLKIGCMVPNISDDPEMRMCISGMLIEGNEDAITVSKALSKESIDSITQEDKPTIFFKSFTSPIFPDVSKCKSPSGLISSRNSTALLDPLIIDRLLCEGEVEKSCAAIQFNKQIFDEQSIESVITPTLSLIQPYLCSFNLLFWDSIFSIPLIPQIIDTPPVPITAPIPLLRGLALVFPLATTSLYVYKPSHLYMLRKYLNSPFVVTPPGTGEVKEAEIGTVCRVEEICSIGGDGGVLCRVRGDNRVKIVGDHRVTTEFGSVLGDVEFVGDEEGNSVQDKNGKCWKEMSSMREGIIKSYEGKEGQLNELYKRFGTIPHDPTMSSVIMASGKDKESWFEMRSTKLRLQAIKKFLKSQ